MAIEAMDLKFESQVILQDQTILSNKEATFLIKLCKITAYDEKVIDPVNNQTVLVSDDDF